VKEYTLSLAPGPEAYEIGVCGYGQGRCVTKIQQETTDIMPPIDDDPWIWAKFVISIGLEYLQQVTDEEIPSKAIPAIKAELGENFECDNSGATFGGVDKSLVTFSCLMYMKNELLPEFQKQSEIVRKKLLENYKAQNVIVSQTVTDMEEAKKVSEGGLPWTQILIVILLLGAVGYYVYEKQLKEQPKWSTIRQYDEEEMEEVSESDHDNQAQDFLREVLIDLGMPPFSINKYLKILRDEHISSVEQLSGFNSHDLTNLGFHDALVKEISRRLNKNKRPKTGMKLNKMSVNKTSSKPDSP